MKSLRTRRSAIKFAAIKFAGAWGAAAWLTPSRLFGGPDVSGANDRIDVAVIGIGMRGKYLIGNLPESLRVTALCDCSLDQIDTARMPDDRFKQMLGPFARGDGATAKIYQNYRVMLDRQRFDAVIIAAPDHHHADAAILAMQAGCDVYVEKPLAVTISEGRAIVAAARKYDRVVQVGSQQRTMDVNRRACEFLRDGGLGRIVRVEGTKLSRPDAIRPENVSR